MTSTAKTVLRTTCVFAIIGLGSAASSENGNLLEDASFEEQRSPGAGGWVLFDESRYSDEKARSGDSSLYSWGLSRTTPAAPFFIGTTSGSYQEMLATPGSRWRLTGYGLAARPLEGAPAFGIVQLSFFDADGNDLGTVETADGTSAKARTSNEFSRSSPADEWIRLDTGVATAPAGAETVQAFTLFVDFSGSNRAQGVYFDDLVLCRLDDGATACGD